MTTIRMVEERDRETILSIAHDTEVFTAQDVECVDELLDTYLRKRDSDEYTFIAATDGDDRVIGFLCYGPTPLTDRTFDAYWLAVSRASRRQGAARALFLQMEEDLRKAGARLLVLETSGTPEYAAARRMYDSLGYTGHLAVPDFYRQGDDLLIYSKPLR
jgi:ribosomal protein S18 acetylase RimI-like enzyme